MILVYFNIYIYIYKWIRRMFMINGQINRIMIILYCFVHH